MSSGADPRAVSGPKEPDELSRAPWAPDEMAALEARQAAEHLHPYTCPLHSDTVLEVGPQRLYCPRPDCGYSQDWAHRADTRYRPFRLLDLEL